MTVALAGAARCDDRDVRFDRLRDICTLRIDDRLVEKLRSAFPGPVFGFVNPRLVHQALLQLAIGALERAHEGALFLPALPDDFLRLVVAGACFGFRYLDTADVIRLFCHANFLLLE